jgi:AraC family transcriptional regulator of adaptative response/methylated-DNA-[protein]-cysteine methyltransferase
MVALMTRGTDGTTQEDDRRWRAVLDSDRSLDGAFVTAVRTTRIYCRPSCPARKPKRENVEFFATPDGAERAGYRACKRCRPREGADPQRELIGRICERLVAGDGTAPTLNELGAEFHISPFHLQRTFKRITGVTPRQYAAAHRVGQLKQELRAAGGVAGAVYRAGFGSSSRVYEQTSRVLGMTPAAYGRGGRGMRITYTVQPCALGQVLVATTERGIAFVCLGDTAAPLEEELHREYPAATIARDGRAAKQYAATVVRAIRDGHPDHTLPVDVLATAFQARVWQALREIPRGETRSYAEVARAIGRPTAVRAVARACADNPTPIIVPCHRVVHADGTLSGFRWGIGRKRELLERERRSTKATKESIGDSVARSTLR